MAGRFRILPLLAMMSPDSRQRGTVPTEVVIATMGARNGRSPGTNGVAAARPDLRWEQAFWRGGLSRVAGVDEVGRGAMAGPLVAAAVVFPACEGWGVRRLRSALAGVRDSKLLTPERRLALLGAIEQTAHAIGIGIVPVEEIDAIGLGPANRIAMERSVLGIEDHVDALVIDACVLDLGCPQSGPIDGDALSLSVAAASIVAKVTRDRMMTDLSHAEPRYGFELHKGYCSELHKSRLAEYGPSPHHRRCFAPVAEWNAAS